MKKTLPADAILVPDNAKLVFKGQIFDVYQWPQTLFNGKTATFELLRRPDTVQVIAIQDGKIVMIHDHQPHKGDRFGFPGGRADDTDESWEAAAKRELLEETGLRFRQWRLVQVQQPQPKIEWFGVVYLAWDFVEQIAAQHDAGGEDIQAELVDFARAKQLVREEHVLGFVGQLFTQAETVDDLLRLPSFEGRVAER